MLEFFKSKEQSILKAIDRVKSRLAFYSATADQRHEDWNDWHDLKDRLEGRLKDNWSAYHDWHWSQYGFNIY